MKEKILKALRGAEGSFVSGAKLCSRLGVSRQAVWKNIAALKESGYEIESVTGKGYRLVFSPDCLSAADIMSRLPKDCICNRVEAFESIDSTNTRAKQRAELGEAEGLFLVADEQTAGKGRRGRVWSSEPGVGIYMTVLLRPQLAPYQVPGVTLLAALAMVDAVRRVCYAKAQIKWPNDVILAKKKICGILTEMSSEENYTHYVVTGIGVNANTVHFPEEIADTATSLYKETGKKVDRCALAAAWAAQFSGYYKRFMQEKSLAFAIDQYNRVLANRDKEVRIYYGMVEEAKEGKTETGIARGIDSEGALLVETEGKIKRVVSGEVSVRGLYGYV